MKINARAAYYCTVVLCFLCCSKPAVFSGIEITNGTCVGRIINGDGTAAQMAVVRLIPSDFNPYAQSRAAIDTSLTNGDGAYVFDVSRPGYYNIVAEKGPTSCLRDSIFVEAEARTIVDPDTLRQSGWFAGAVRLKPGDDSRQAVILVLGTDIYTMPHDTSGAFASPLLPKGNYTIRIFTSVPGYAALDTAVAVRVGGETRLSVSLASSDAPSVAGFTASYDSAMMRVILSWSAPDTSRIVSYALYRKSGRGNDTMITLGRASTSYVDDVIYFDGDSISYQIAAAGKQYKEGYRAAAGPIIVAGMVPCVKAIDVSGISKGLESSGSFSIWSDRESDIFLLGYDVVYKLDADGVVRKDYVIDGPDREYSYFSGKLQSDDAGNVYACKYHFNDSARSMTVMKFDRDLNVLRRLEFDSRYYDPRHANAEITGNGGIIAFLAADEGTDVTVFDSSFAASLPTLHLPGREIRGGSRFGDTVATYEFTAASGDTLPSVHLYDASFREVGSWRPLDRDLSGYLAAPFDFRDGFCIPPLYSEFDVAGARFMATRRGICVIVKDGWVGERKSLLIFTASNGEFLARMVVPSLWSYTVDAAGNLYCCRYVEDEGEIVDGPVTLYKYSLMRLWSGKGR